MSSLKISLYKYIALFIEDTNKEFPIAFIHVFPDPASLIFFCMPKSENESLDFLIVIVFSFSLCLYVQGVTSPIQGLLLLVFLLFSFTLSVLLISQNLIPDSSASTLTITFPQLIYSNPVKLAGFFLFLIDTSDL